MSTAEPSESPPICAAVDLLIDESGMNARDLAAKMNVDESTVSRWRRSKEPDRETVRRLEEVLGRPVGWCNARAGFGPEPTTYNRDPVVAAIEGSTHATPSWALIVIELWRTAVKQSKQERSRQQQWREQRRR